MSRGTWIRRHPSAWSSLRSLTATFIALCLAAPVAMGAGSFRDQFMDEQDGWFDTSDWLATQHGFLPVPIIITEPAIGYGGGAALLFFHGRGEMHEDEGKIRGAGRQVVCHTVVEGVADVGSSAERSPSRDLRLGLRSDGFGSR